MFFLLRLPIGLVTLEEKIRQYILPGTGVISDGWPSYARIDSTDGGIYTYDVTEHEQHFVDPDDADIHALKMLRTCGCV